MHVFISVARMMKMRPLGIAALLFTTSLFAGPAIEFKQSQPSVREVPLNIVRLEVTQTFQSDFKHHRGDDPNQQGNNNTNTWNYEFEASRRVRLTGNWYLRLGIDVARWDFGDNRSLAPNTLNADAALIALEYFTDEGERGFFIESRPGVYFAHDFARGAFDMPTNLALAYPLVPGKFYLIGGVTVGLLREYPVLPLAGVLWHIDSKWDLRAYLPEPKLVYKASDTLEIWGGGEIAGGAFRNDSRSDEAGKRLSGTPVEYYEIRAGAGVNWLPRENFSIDFAAGWTFVRKFDFYRADVTQETQGAPYVKLAGDFAF